MPGSRFPIRCGNSGVSQTFKAEFGMFMFAWIFRTFWPKMAVLGAKYGNVRKGWYDGDPQRTHSYFGGCYLCATFGEKLSRNVTVRVQTDR